MGLFEQFPYTNFHEANLDEIVKVVGQAEGAVGEAVNKATEALRVANNANTLAGRAADDIIEIKATDREQSVKLSELDDYKADKQEIGFLDDRVKVLEAYAFDGVEPYSKAETNERIESAMSTAAYRVFEALGAVINRTIITTFTNGISDTINVDAVELMGEPVEGMIFNVNSMRVAVNSYLPCTVRVINPNPRTFSFKIVETNPTSGTKQADILVSYLIH